MKIIPVPADGDCLYHAFIKGLGIKTLLPQHLRDFVASKILSDKDLYDDIVREWIDFNVIPNAQNITPEKVANHIRNTKEWATSTVIHILAVAFNVRITVFQKINGQFYPEIFPSEWKQHHDEKWKTVGKLKNRGNKWKKDAYYKDIYLLRRGYHFELLIPVGPSNSSDSSSPYISSSKSNGALSPSVGQRGGGGDDTFVADDAYVAGEDDNFFLTVSLGIAGIVLFLWTF